MKAPLSIYVHIPFCLKKCLYCDFLSAPAPAQVREDYVQALCEEIKAQSSSYGTHEVQTIFFGGGTPSLLLPEQVERLMHCLHRHFLISQQAEITMEMNPGTVSKELLKVCQSMGINRISLGLQSADDGELERLGRIHTWADFLESYTLCREMGFANLNIDLMSALPGQSLTSCLMTLEKVTALQPEHISAYSLILEEGTPFYEKYAGKAGEKELPDEALEQAMDRAIRSCLLGCGYERYEISNYARPGRECAHNLVYWQRGDYAGFGLGASSMVGNVRWKNEERLSAYLSGAEKRCQGQPLSVKEQMEETMYLGLRLVQGVDRQRFLDTFGCSVEAVYGKVLQKHSSQGLMTVQERFIALTERGMDVSNYVMADFLLSESGQGCL